MPLSVQDPYRDDEGAAWVLPLQWTMVTLAPHSTFARFEDKRLLRACLKSLRQYQAWHPDMSVTLQSLRRGHEELPLALTHARAGIVRGVLVGAGVGLVAGLSIALVESKVRGIDVSLIALFCVFGLVLGGFAGALVAPMNPDPTLEKLEKDGDVVVAVESKNDDDLYYALRTFEQCGATSFSNIESSPPSSVHERAKNLPKVGRSGFREV